MAYQKLETRDDDLEVWACDGLCFSPSRVVADILLLAGAHAETGTFLGPDEDSQSAYLREISRTLSSISLYCRQQMTSFFHRYGTEVPTKEKIARLKKDYPSADQAISAFVGILECRETGELKPLRFYDMIGKLCHVEKWTYPVSSTFKGRCTKGGGRSIVRRSVRFRLRSQFAATSRSLGIQRHALFTFRDSLMLQGSLLQVVWSVSLLKSLRPPTVSFMSEFRLATAHRITGRRTGRLQAEQNLGSAQNLLHSQALGGLGRYVP